MKQYNNGQRPQKMYGGGMAMPRKPMQIGGLAQQNRTQQTPMAKNMGMGMTEQKKYGMGMNLGGAIAKFEGRQKKSSGSKVKNYLGQKVTGKQKNVNGASASERLYFTRSFPRMSLVKQ